MCGLRTGLSLPPKHVLCLPSLCHLPRALKSDLGLWDGMLLSSGAVCKSRHVSSDDLLIFLQLLKPVNPPFILWPGPHIIHLQFACFQVWRTEMIQHQWNSELIGHPDIPGCGATYQSLRNFRNMMKLWCSWLGSSGFSARSNLNTTAGTAGFLGEQICF